MIENAQTSQRPVRPLSTYRTMEVEVPFCPEVRRFICPDNHTIYINASSRDGANIDEIIPYSLRQLHEPEVR